MHLRPVSAPVAPWRRQQQAMTQAVPKNKTETVPKNGPDSDPKSGPQNGSNHSRLSRKMEPKPGPESGPKNGTRNRPQKRDRRTGPATVAGPVPRSIFCPGKRSQNGTADTTNKNHLTMYDDFECNEHGLACGTASTDRAVPCGHKSESLQQVKFHAQTAASDRYLNKSQVRRSR